VFSRVDSSISLNSLSWLDFILKPSPDYLTPNLYLLERLVVHHRL
jgi:hypothetical protein